MKTYFFLLITLFYFFSCKKEPSKIEPKHTGTEKIKYWEQDSQLILESGKFRYKIPKTKLPFKKIILLNASLIGYITELQLESTIIGVSSPEYIYSKKIHFLLNKNKIHEIGNEQKYDLEKIIALQPDAIFTNYVASFQNTYDLLKKNNIEIIFIDEYLEENPLDKSKIIMVFGKLLGKENLANSVYKNIENNYLKYQKIAQTTPENPLVLSNEMYGNQWFVAGGNSSLAHFIKDAHGTYIFGDDTQSKSTPKSFEEVFLKAENAKFWVNIGNHTTKNELIQINPNYQKMNVFRNGKLYALTQREIGKSNDYFESGVVHSDLVLRDYIQIFHPEVFPNQSLIYMKELR